MDKGCGMFAELILRKATECPADRFGVKQVILYGHQPAAKMADSENLDLLIVCDLRGSRNDTWLAMDTTLRALDLPTELVVVSPEEFERDRSRPDTIAGYAAREGRVIYEHRNADHENLLVSPFRTAGLSPPGSAWAPVV